MPNYDAEYGIEKCLKCTRKKCNNCLVNEPSERECKLSKKTKERIIELYNRGYRCSEIAKEMCRTHDSIYTFLRRSGIITSKIEIIGSEYR